MNISFLVVILTGLTAIASAEDLRLVDLPPEEAQQYIESKDQTLKYAPKIESNVPAVRVLGDTPTNVLEDNYLANQYHGQDGLGGYLYGYSVPDIAKTEKKKAGGDLKGAYQYINDAGQEIKVQYWDDGTGFHQVDNLPEILPKQVEDAPDVQAAKDEFFKRWHEEAERNSKPVSPEGSQQQYQQGQSGQNIYGPYQTGQHSASSDQSSATYPGQNQYNNNPTHPGQNFYHSTQNQPSQNYHQSQHDSYQSSQSKPHQNQYHAGHTLAQPGQNQYLSSQGEPNQNQYGSGPSQYHSGQIQPDQNQYQSSNSQTQPSQYQSSYNQAQPNQYQSSHSQTQPDQNQYQSSHTQAGPDQSQYQYGQNQYQSVQGKPSQTGQGQTQQNQNYLPGQSHQSAQTGAGQFGREGGQNQYEQNQPSIRQHQSGHPSQNQYQTHSSQSSQYQPISSQGSASNQVPYYQSSQNQGSPTGASGCYLPGQSGPCQSGVNQQNHKAQNQPSQENYKLSQTSTSYGHTSYPSSDYSGQPSNQETWSQNQDSNGWEWKATEEEKGPPKGFFYNFDYPVGIIVQKQGATGGVHKRENLEHLYTQNKANFRQQVKNGASEDGSSQTSYQVHL